MWVVIDYFRVDSPGFPVDFTFTFLECSDILFAFLEIDIFPKFWHTHFLLISSTGVNGLFSWKACIFIERNNKFKQLEEFTFAHAPYWTKHNQEKMTKVNNRILCLPSRLRIRLSIIYIAHLCNFFSFLIIVLFVFLKFKFFFPFVFF